MTDPKPTFLTNQDGTRVADGINAHLEHLRTQLINPYELAIATAYFNVGGYQLLADELDHPRRVRLLLGAEPDQNLRTRRLDEPVAPARAQAMRVRRALEGHDRALADARDLLGFTFDADRGARRLLDWLRSGTVEVRRLTDRFLHGKAFITITDHDEGVIAGSSNFTYAGLATNIELNLGQYQPNVVTDVRAWFDELWDVADPYDLAALYEGRFDAHPPQLIYLRMLWERYGAEVEAEAEVMTRGAIHLTTFQRDGLWRARRILAERRGVLIADEVGLGKTFLAGKLIEEAAIERRQRVLVVAPATLRDGPWRKFASDFNLPIELRSFDDLIADRRLIPTASGFVLDQDPDDYALVVIDEAHNARNPGTQRAEALRRLLAGAYRKDLVLLTATPVNNSLWDLYYLLVLFLRNDAVFTDLGIPSMRDHFARAMALNPDDLSPEYLFDVLDAVAVRRTRPFVKRFYPTDTVRIAGRDVPITFPTPRVRRVSYDLDAVLPGFFDRFAAALDADDVGHPDPDRRPGVLTLARYAPSRYGPGGVDAREVQLTGLLRSGLLKRFESSPYAFARTCDKMADSHDGFLALLATGKIATGSALRDWAATDSDDPDEVEEYLHGHWEELEDAADYDIDLLRAHVAHDRDLLRQFAAEADTVTRDQDPNLAAVVEELAEIAEQAAAEGVTLQEIRDKRKVLIFSYFADTVDWIVDYLCDVVVRDDRLACYRDRISALTGSDGDKRDVLWGFAPRTTDAPEPDDRYDIVVTTDVLAEGVNLQQARHIINYDLPWNPQRLVQRHGRIDRIGSFHTEVFLRCVFPDQRLDDLLGLEERLHRKIKQAAAAIGVGEILPGSRTADVTFAETREEVERLRAEDPTIFEFGGVGRTALSGEEYRQELRRALDNPEVAGRIRDLPWGSGSGMAVPVPAGAQGGYVFCIRVGDHPTPQFRYVTAAADGAPLIVDDTLACLDRARPPEEWDTPRDLDEQTYRGAFEAWDLARGHVVDRWNFLADPANLAPVVPAVMRRAAQTVRDHTTGVDLEQIDRAVEALEAPYAERILRLFRQALTVENGTERARVVLDLVRDLGLEPPPPPEPLPEVTGNDVHLLCWLALVPEAPATRTDLVSSEGSEMPLG
ncbi:helicase [Blastococcus sp. KM273128]|uniref:helicase-related protein n=1 Tax=Blastococcus sp. KM273128 TaxID=2570314 RepID=UPI001F3639B8|nr:helicase-related protein [Blastococcus sp. KM273128]MCF6745102.1 helicase [Blastococcus sp. KM273128]